MILKTEFNGTILHLFPTAMKHVVKMGQFITAQVWIATIQLYGELPIFVCGTSESSAIDLKQFKATYRPI